MLEKRRSFEMNHFVLQSTFLNLLQSINVQSITLFGLAILK